MTNQARDTLGQLLGGVSIWLLNWLLEIAVRLPTCLTYSDRLPALVPAESGWFPGQDAAGSEFRFHIWFSHCPCVLSIQALTADLTLTFLSPLDTAGRLLQAYLLGSMPGSLPMHRVQAPPPPMRLP